MELQGVPKVRSSKFMHHSFWSKLHFYMKLLEDVYFSIEYMYSEFQLLACPFCFWMTFCSRCCMKWDTACRPTDGPFWAFLSPGAQGPVQPPKFNLGSWKKIYFGHSSKKDNHPCLLPQQDFVLLYKFETSWALLGRISRGFLTKSRASNFKHFKQLFITLSGLGLLTNVRTSSLSLLFYI